MCGKKAFLLDAFILDDPCWSYEKITKTIVRLLRVSICDSWKSDLVDGEPMNRVSTLINLRLVKVEIDHSEVCVCVIFTFEPCHDRETICPPTVARHFWLGSVERDPCWAQTTIAKPSLCLLRVSICDL